MIQKYLKIVLAVLVVIAAPLAYWVVKDPDVNLRSNPADQLLSAEYGVKEVDGNSFGNLALLTSAASGRGGDMMARELANPSASSAQLTNNIAVAPAPGGSGGGSDSKLIAPFVPEDYRFRYIGEDLGELAVEQPVYRRVKENVSTGIIDRLISTLSLGLIDLTRFDSTKLQNFALTEDKQYGYSIYVDVAMGMLSLYQNYNQWPQPLAECRDEDCYRENMPKLADIPEDSEMIAIANQFIADKNVSLEGFVQPKVVNNWRQHYENSDDQANFYFPEVIEVIYPIILDGNTVFDEGGSESGMHVSVSIRERRVVGLYDLATKQYEKSNYAGETDSDRIVDLAEAGGFRSYSDPGVRAEKIVTLDLETPTRQVLRMWKYDGNNSEELYVPALVFPIRNPGQYWRQNLIVPLVREILDQDQQPPVTIYKGGAGATEPAPAVDLPLAE